MDKELELLRKQKKEIEKKIYELTHQDIAVDYVSIRKRPKGCHWILTIDKRYLFDRQEINPRARKNLMVGIVEGPNRKDVIDTIPDLIE
mgnify:CR=1 FL=1